CFRGLTTICVFCFQAEDGIRDFHVTGVQTCALPIYARRHWPHSTRSRRSSPARADGPIASCPCRPGFRPPGSRWRRPAPPGHPRDRKSTRLNSSHVKISYAVFCLKKKNKECLEYIKR